MDLKHLIAPLVMALTTVSSANDDHLALIGQFPDQNAPLDISLKQCDLQVEGIKYQAECGHLVVPENWNSETSRRLYLPLIRVKGSDKISRVPLVFLSGGPGASNMKALPSRQQLEQHDYILLGYRGVDGSVVLDCPEFTDALPQAEAWFGHEAKAVNESSLVRCFKRHTENGTDINAYQIPAMIEDLELMRRLLGYSQINLLSRSFGTRVALLYAHRYPDSIKRSVLMAANPPGRMVWEAEQLDQKIQLLSDYCREDEYCHTKARNLVTTFRSVLRDMPESWMGLSIDADRVKAAAFMMLYSKKSMPYVIDAFVAAERGDASGLALLSNGMNFMGMSGMKWGDLFIKAATADYDETRDYEKAFNPKGSIFGAPMSEFTWTVVPWGDLQQIPASYRGPQISDVETLVVSGDLDVSTPSENAAKEILPYLSGGRQVILKQAGHTDLYAPDTVDMYLKFFENGEVNTSQLIVQPIQFEPAYSLGFVARAGLFLAMLLVVALFGLFWWGGRKVWRKYSR